MSTLHRPENSTTVRSLPIGIRALRAGLWLASRAAEPLATRVALDLFMRPRRFRRPAWERTLLFHADTEKVKWHGRTLPLWSWGEGPVVLLVHGWEGRGSQLGAMVDPLVQKGFRVVTFDAPGHGDGPGHHASIPEIADALAAVRAHVGPIHAVVAHSMGAVALMLAASRRPLATRHVSVAAPTHISNAFAAFADVFELEPNVREALAHAVEDRFALRLEELELEALAERVLAPTLVVHDRDDRDVPFASGERLASALPNARLLSTSGLGHRRVLRDKNVLESIVAFVEEGAPPRKRGFPLAESLVRELFDRPSRDLDV